MIALELNKVNNWIRFYEKGHKYKNLNNGERLTSVTTLLSKYKQPFEKEYWLAYKAFQKHGFETKGGRVFITDEYGDKKLLKKNIQALDPYITSDIRNTIVEIQNEWKYLNRYSTEKGSALHNYIENFYTGKIVKPHFDENMGGKYGLRPIKETLKILASQFKEFHKDYDHLIPVGNEIIVGDDVINIAGMFDQLFYNKLTAELELFDWKTNKKMSTSNKFQKMKAPLHDLDECEFNTYCLQLNLYKHILEKNCDLKIGAMNIVWFYEENDSYKILPVPDMAEHINKLLSQLSLNL